MGHFQPVGNVREADTIYEEITEIDGLGWQTYPHANHDSALLQSGIFKAGSELIKKGSATKIETQTLYFCDPDTGYCGFIQFLNSNLLGGFYKSFEMNVRVYNLEKSHERQECQGQEGGDYVEYWRNIKLTKPSIFTPLEVSSKEMSFNLQRPIDPDWDGPAGASHRSRAYHHNAEAKERSRAKNIGTLSIEGQTEELQIGLEVEIGNGYKIKPDGRSFFSTVPIKGNPNVDRCIRHVFSPNCTGSGYIVVNSRRINLQSVPMILITAMQGLKPNSAAKCWNFATFISHKRCILCMEFTTPPEYGEQTVTITSDTNKETSKHQVYCGTQHKDSHVKHFGLKLDPKTNVEYPNVIEVPLPMQDGELTSSLLLGPLNLINEYDILQEMPAVLKSIVEKIEGINPHLYQFCQRTDVDDESGISLVETTFISP
ncbi:unnamed protein product [Kluyveromyces dobzhanskii CBS 2104]|uniref:WGS project CCBQ000000000 data, contig 00010 n=1 Tax=Kluyveromyces dobzhanskii CBS 2104 TaxID=1427455 RepID=A0A0A8LCP5_9SACH|nr:unnamed protein product [Kluyveromyces dobzhanskii CBS 2104]